MKARTVACVRREMQVEGETERQKQQKYKYGNSSMRQERSIARVSERKEQIVKVNVQQIVGKNKIQVEIERN